VILNTEPGGCSIILDDTLRSETTSCIINNLSDGPHTIILSNKECDDCTLSFRIEKEKIQGNILSLCDSVIVHSIPDGALIYRDSIMENKTNRTIYNVPVGQHLITLTHIHYKDYKESIYVKEKSIKAKIDFDSDSAIINYIDPLRINVYLRSDIFTKDSSFGISPKVIRNIPLGGCTIKLKQNGYGDRLQYKWIRKRSISANIKTNQNNINIELISPRQCSVFVDDKFIGIKKKAFVLKKLPIKIYTIKLCSGGYGDYIIEKPIEYPKVELKDYRKNLDTLHILKINPKDARIFINGIDVGTMPLRNYKIGRAHV
jgi:hypothetical protein